LLQFCCEDQLLALIHEGGLISKLKGMLNPLDDEFPHYEPCYGPNATINKLAAVWTLKARSISQELYKLIQGRASCCHSCCLVLWP
jgi:hypothetical protein